MNMIGHQAIRVQIAFRARKMATKVKKIKTAILVLEKHILAIVSPVTHMYRNVGQHDPGAPRHVWLNAEGCRPLTRNVVCP
jgi:hypothetical protein